MKKIVRIMTTINSRFDNLVNQMENHQAVAESTVRQLRLDIRDSKVQYKILEKELSKAQSKETESKKQIEVWKQRAKAYGEHDREKALHCLKRMKQGENQFQLWQTKQIELDKVSKALLIQIENIEGQYQEIQTRMSTLSSREQSAKMQTRTHQAQNRMDTDSLDTIFERWEKKVCETEVGNSLDSDSFDSTSVEIESQEQQLDLEADLDALLSENL